MEKRSRKSRIATLAAIMTVTFMTMNVYGQGSKANFSGTWAYNAEKSNTGQTAEQGQGQRMGGFGGNFTAKQESNLLTVERTRTNREGVA
ncbi:MAG TPA: hypothetical protein VMV74_09035, partial [Bacteroidales bacterium]|nr:hypothetical protein [Bacteroidales bacterium]